MGKMNRRGENAPKKINKEDQKRKAVELRKRGAGMQEIASAMGISVSWASRLIKQALNEYKEATQEEVEHLRDIEISRLDQMFRKYYPKALEGDVEAAKLCLKLQDQRAKYHNNLQNPDELMITGDPNKPIQVSHEHKAVPIQAFQKFSSEQLEEIEAELGDDVIDVDYRVVNDDDSASD